MDQTIDLDCEKCGAPLRVTFRDVAQGKTVKCRNGHATKLVDKGGARQAQKAMDDLDKALKDFGKR